MKYFLSLLFVFLFSFVAVAQNIPLKGTLYDPNGTVVVGAEAFAVEAQAVLSGNVSDETGASIGKVNIVVTLAGNEYKTRSNEDGSYRLLVPSGEAFITFSGAPGFLET